MELPGLSLILKVLSFLFASWLLVHLLAIFGWFLVVAYPVWWLLFPEQIICFGCRFRKDGEICPFCRQSVNRAEKSAPRNLTSAILNGGLVSLLALFSLGFVGAESQILKVLGFPPTAKTVSFLIPTKGQYRLGEVFPLKIEIAGVKTAINAVQADLGFDPKILEVVEISTQDSFASLFIQKEVNNEVGFARLTGGVPNPGFTQPSGVFETAFFRGKSPGAVKVEFLPSSLVLANDGRGTNVLKELAAASYLILPEEISPEESRQQESYLQTRVLGEQTPGTSSEGATQLKFYGESGVLGTQMGEAASLKDSSPPGVNVIEVFLNILEKIDRLILDLWPRIYHLFVK